MDGDMSQLDAISDMLHDLRLRGVEFRLENGRIRLHGPENALTNEVTRSIQKRKADIIEFLSEVAESSSSELALVPAHGSALPPLSRAQQRLWFVEQMAPNAGLHHMPFAIGAHGELDLPALKAALAAIVERHSVLRSRIRTPNGEPIQEIVDDCIVPFHTVERPGCKPDDAEIREFLRQEMRRPFDLTSEPPLRVTLLRFAADRHLFLFTLHHICADGASMEIFFAELVAAYRRIKGEAVEAPAALPVQYTDFAAWQRQEPLQKSLAFWTSNLENLPATRLATDFPRPAVHEGRAGYHQIELSAETCGQLRELARRERSTLFATLFTAFDILLSRYCGQNDLVVGTPFANRRHPETEGLIGLFVNPLPVRVKLSPFEGFARNLQRVQKALWSAYEHQHVPFERLVEELQPERDPSLSPLFQLKFQLDQKLTSTVELPGMELRRLDIRDGTAPLDLSLNLQEEGEIVKGAFVYDAALFHARTIADLADRFTILLAEMLAKPDEPICSLHLLSEPERQRQLFDWNDTRTPYDTERRFHELFEEQVAARPDETAILYAGDDDVESWSFDRLNRKANQIAHCLRSRGVLPETVVAIALDRGPEMVAAWLGVLKAGGAWLPLDPAYPAERLEYMFADSGAKLVLTTSDKNLSDSAERIDLDVDWPDRESTANPVNVSSPNHLAYVIYTSGSTGKPKGVLVEHAGLVNLAQDKIRVCGVRPGDCVLQFFSFSFDASIPELIMSLGAGARLLLLPAEEALPGPQLASQMRRHRVTHITITPSALTSLPSEDFPDLRMVLVGGEAPTPDLIERWGSDRLFVNAYGPTETTVNASMVACDGESADAVVSPSANKQLYVLDENMEAVPVGMPGELFIGGLGLARGYKGRPALTAERFLPDPFRCGGEVIYRTGDRARQLADGRIRLLGRIDSQVKIRGFRIEPGEIESAILSHPDIAAAAVVIREDSPGEKRINAFCVAREGRVLGVAALGSWLATKLPRYMAPDNLAFLESLPLTVNGKVDLAALPQIDRTDRAAGRAPETPTEQKIAAVFEDVLGIGDVSASDDFFQLGGHSLLATRLCAHARTQFGMEIAVLDLFRAPTVEGLAARLDAGSGKPSGDGEEFLAGDIRLDDDIVPHAVRRGEHPPRNILLTGATGFFGVFILAELLRAPARKVWCLLRGRDADDRLKAALERHGLWNDCFRERIRIVEGDLAAPGLGVSAETQDELCREIDAIVHNGAQVHHLHPYEAMRAANVSSVREVLRLASRSGCFVHYVSSISALTRPDDSETLLESSPIDSFPPPSGGYNRSKWAGEHLATEAVRRGMPVTIHRPGAISGDTINGTFNEADILCRLMQGYLRSGIAPARDVPLQLLPVDHGARILTEIVDSPESAGQTYHLLHSGQVSSALLFDACRQEGMAIRRVNGEEWQAHVSRIARDEPDHPLYPLVGLLERSDRSGGRVQSSAVPMVDCRAMRMAAAKASRSEPRLDADLFRIYLRAFTRSGALSLSAPVS
ncbi:amino acid adenylation domain-containing protein [Fulvimarina sp. MAC8]|uniref:amino acid adenylation domain-containing protein n=1 Tax=Fulvimarina sp. MAC8 TaxID=3162874 RepID=UPI0032EE9EA8